MKLHYYPETDSLYVEFKSGPGVGTVEVTQGLNVDLDGSGGVDASGAKMHYIYDRRAVGGAFLALFFKDGSVEDEGKVLLPGWYKDGELTGSRQDATVVPLSVMSDVLERRLPGHPDAHPRLKKQEYVPCY